MLKGFKGFVMRGMSTLKARVAHREDEVPAKKPDDVVLLDPIRDLLAQRPV